MKTGEYIRTLAEFVSGEIELPRFRQLVEERLFELRRNPDITDETRFLSIIELYLHEAEEGLREEAEVYAIVQFTLDDILLTRLRSKGVGYFSPIPPKLPYTRSTTFDIEPPDKKKSKTENLSLAVTR